MSFGFSVGDFLAVGRLIFDITNALRGSKGEYQELVRELESSVQPAPTPTGDDYTLFANCLCSLGRALEEVDKLKSNPRQSDAVNRIKCAALTCRQPLEDFNRRIHKFDGSLGTGQSNGKLRDAGKKIQWAVGPGRKDEVNKLRSYLNIHIGIINLQMVQQGFEAIKFDIEEGKAEQEAFKNSLEGSAQVLKDIRGDVHAQSLIVKEHGSTMGRLCRMVTGDVVAPLRALTNMVAKVFTSTQQIYNILIEIRANIGCIETRFTYFQDPVKVEDVLGRRFYFPSECCIEALHAEIGARFKEGPGKLEIAAGDYEIFNAQDSNSLLNAENGSILLPAMSVHMAILREKNGEQSHLCPNWRCKSNEAIFAPCGGKICIKCNVWYDESPKRRKRKFDDRDISTYLNPRPEANERSDSAVSTIDTTKDERDKVGSSHNEYCPSDGFKRIKMIQKAPAQTPKDIMALIRDTRYEIPNWNGELLWLHYKWYEADAWRYCFRKVLSNTPESTTSISPDLQPYLNSPDYHDEFDFPVTKEYQYWLTS